MFLPLLLLKKDRERERIPAQSLPEINVSDKEQVRIVGQEASRLIWSCMFIVLCVTCYVLHVMCYMLCVLCHLEICVVPSPVCCRDLGVFIRGTI